MQSVRMFDLAGPSWVSPAALHASLGMQRVRMFVLAGPFVGVTGCSACWCGNAKCPHVCPRRTFCGCHRLLCMHLWACKVSACLTSQDLCGCAGCSACMSEHAKCLRDCPRRTFLGVTGCSACWCGNAKCPHVCPRRTFVGVLGALHACVHVCVPSLVCQEQPVILLFACMLFRSQFFVRNVACRGLWRFLKCCAYSHACIVVPAFWPFGSLANVTRCFACMCVHVCICACMYACCMRVCFLRGLWHEVLSASAVLSKHATS
jgi:hypothetical protein